MMKDSVEKGLFALGRYALRPSLNIEINNFDLTNIKRSTWTSTVASNEEANVIKKG